MKRFEIVVRDSFFKKDFTGVFEGETQEEAEQECREFYAVELDTFEAAVEIVSVKEI